MDVKNAGRFGMFQGENRPLRAKVTAVSSSCTPLPPFRNVMAGRGGGEGGRLYEGRLGKLSASF